jgi:hypothetical protein
VVTDKAAFYPSAIRVHAPGATHTATGFYNRVISTNRCERDLGRVKSRLRPIRGLESFDCAKRLFSALDATEVDRAWLRPRLVYRSIKSRPMELPACPAHCRNSHPAGLGCVARAHRGRNHQTTTSFRLRPHANVGEPCVHRSWRAGRRGVVKLSAETCGRCHGACETRWIGSPYGRTPASVTSRQAACSSTRTSP